MSWNGPALSAEQRDLLAVMDSLAAQHGPVLDETPHLSVDRLVQSLSQLGIWALGAPESVGGSGADRATTLMALERLGRTWPALGWACAQSHAALRVLAAHPRLSRLAHEVSAGEAAVAVVDAASDHVRLTRQGETLTGSVARVDVAHLTPHVLVLTDSEAAVLIPPACTITTPLRRTGLAGAMTCAVQVAGSFDDFEELSQVDVREVRCHLRLGAAAVAGGIAAAAADDARKYATDRRQFGDALIALPTVRLGLLDQAARATVVLNAVMAAPDQEVASLAILRGACEAAVEVAAASVQAHGGYGYLAEYGIERRLRDAVSLRAATDVNNASASVARSLVGLSPTRLAEDGR